MMIQAFGFKQFIIICQLLVLKNHFERLSPYCMFNFLSIDPGVRRGRYRMIVGFSTTYVISANHHWSYWFQCRSGGVYSIQLYMRLVAGWWYSPGIPVSSTNKTDQHDIPGIALKVALNTITLTHFPFLIVVAQNWIIFVVLRISILPLSTLLIFDFGIVPTAW